MAETTMTRESSGYSAIISDMFLMELASLIEAPPNLNTFMIKKISIRNYIPFGYEKNNSQKDLKNYVDN
jgi:hypothetical protein